MSKHTKETCFRLIGYPEWWEDNHKPSKEKETRGRAAAAIGDSEATGHRMGSNAGRDDGRSGSGEGEVKMATGARVSSGDDFNGKSPFHYEGTGLDDFNERNPFNYEGTGSGPFIPDPLSILDNSTDGFTSATKSNALINMGGANVVNTRETKNTTWIFDCGATDTMTFDASDLCTQSRPSKTHVFTASGEITPVHGAGTISISPTLKLSNCLYVPDLSHKLLSISHVTKELNCTVLMHPSFCILQDIRTGEIIGRGTERRGLYYVDEIAHKGTVMLATGTRSQAAWLWPLKLIMIHTPTSIDYQRKQCKHYIS
ncbi:hypothetical protein C2S51_006554 [Perilla frutescens var. frutescens]|nr:hypothetical protein C2S51_006554 [Perilla frutescens var. frutescens]